MERKVGKGKVGRCRKDMSQTDTTRTLGRLKTFAIDEKSNTLTKAPQEEPQKLSWMDVRANQS